MYSLVISPLLFFHYILMYSFIHLSRYYIGTDTCGSPLAVFGSDGKTMKIVKRKIDIVINQQKYKFVMLKFKK